HRADQGTAQAAQERSQHEHPRVERVDVDPERAERLAVEGGGPDEAARARVLQHEPEGECDARPQYDDEQVVLGDGSAEEREGAAELGWPAHRFLLRTPEDLRRVAEDQPQRVREEQLVELFLPVQTTEERALDDATP